MLNMTIGGTVSPSLNHPTLTCAGFLCQLTTFKKKRAWPGREGLTLTNSEKKMRRPWLSAFGTRRKCAFLNKVGWCPEEPRAR